MCNDEFFEKLFESVDLIYVHVILLFCTFQAPPSSVLISQQPANPVYNGTKITVSGSYISTSLKVKSIKWQRMNGNAFSDLDITADKYKESTDTGSNPTLVITKVDFSDKTSFRLTVSNGVGIVSSEAVSLNVIDGMYILGGFFMWKHICKLFVPSVSYLKIYHFPTKEDKSFILPFDPWNF